MIRTDRNRNNKLKFKGTFVASCPQKAGQARKQHPPLHLGSYPHDLKPWTKP